MPHMIDSHVSFFNCMIASGFSKLQMSLVVTRDHTVHLCATQVAKTQSSVPCPPHKPVMNIDLVNGMLVLRMGYEVNNGRW